MAANTSPIFGLTPNVGIGAVATTANTSKDLTSGTITLCHTAGSNGAFLQRIRFRPAGTNVATVARVFLNNGSTTATATNNTLWDEITLAATTLSETSALSTYELPMNFAVPSGWRVYITLGTAVAAGYNPTVIGMDY